PWAGSNRYLSYSTFSQAPPGHDLPAHSDSLSNVAQIVALFIWVLVNIVAADNQRPAAQDHCLFENQSTGDIQHIDTSCLDAPTLHVNKHQIPIVDSGRHAVAATSQNLYTRRVHAPNFLSHPLLKHI